VETPDDLYLYRFWSQSWLMRHSGGIIIRPQI